MFEAFKSPASPAEANRKREAAGDCKRKDRADTREVPPGNDPAMK
jgi:hypothetical protein